MKLVVLDAGEDMFPTMVMMLLTVVGKTRVARMMILAVMAVELLKMMIVDVEEMLKRTRMMRSKVAMIGIAQEPETKY